MNQEIKLTQYSHGGGCGCKIAPSILREMLATETPPGSFPNLIVGNNTSDDAAVMAIDDEKVVISTTDFFMPIVDDPFDFGGIASANALSDIYAMGGKPLLAIAILGWPVGKLPPKVAAEVLDGARSICKEAGIPLAGGHSIDSPEPIFGLAVTGTGLKKHIKTNASATIGCELYLTKPLGVGILTTATKQKKLLPEHEGLATTQMLKLNSIGSALAELDYVKAMTDVTGFGLLGHLIEMCEASNSAAMINYQNVPKIDCLKTYLDQGICPGMTQKNFNSYGNKVSELNNEQLHILCDPQTSGGLLIAVEPSAKTEFLRVLQNNQLSLEPIGVMVEQQEKLITIE